MILHMDLPEGDLTIDVERRIGRFSRRDPSSSIHLEGSETPWQTEWERGKSMFFIGHLSTRQRTSPRLRSRNDPVVFAIPSFVGELGESEIEYDRRRGKLTFRTSAGRFPYYLESGTLEWSKTRKLVLGCMDTRLEVPVRISWLSQREYDRRWRGSIAVGDEQVAFGYFGSASEHHHDLNLSLNVYLTKETWAELMTSTDPIIRSVGLLDRRFDRALLDQPLGEPTCCDECARLWRVCLSARR